MPELLMSSVKMYASPTAKPLITLPESTVTHFFTAGRILSYFPTVNANGYTFLKSDVTPELANTLLGSTVDMEHLKLGYGSSSAHVGGSNNTTFGAITQVEMHDDGIDIACKLERSVAKALGFDSDSFGPGGSLGTYSQESDYNPNDGQYIVVDKSDPSKILHSFSYADGQALNLDLSHVDASGKWAYSLYQGNPTYFAVKPISFSGVGHVVDPADRSAITYKLAASKNTSDNLGVNVDNAQNPTLEFVSGLNPSPKFYEKHGIKGTDDKYHLPLPPKGHPEAKKYARAVLTRAHQVTKLSPEQVAAQVKRAKEILGEPTDKSTSGYAGMDDALGANPGVDYTGLYGATGDVEPGNGPTGADMNVWASDLLTHPDILSSNVDQHMKSDEKDGLDKSIPDDHFASCYSSNDYTNTKVDGTGTETVKHRALRIKDDKGNLHRGKLIAAYHQLMGTRGNLDKMRQMPRGSKMHAMAIVRQGLKSTSPIKKVNSSMNEQEVEALKAKIIDLEATQIKSVSKADFDASEAAKVALEAQIVEINKSVATLTAAVAERDLAIKETTDAALSVARFAELDKVLSFSDADKALETHPEYVKSLAALTSEQFNIEVLKRSNAFLVKSLASVKTTGMPLVNPVPYSGNEEVVTERFSY